jgi:alkylated DNA repair dioxygenase AlkB
MFESTTKEPIIIPDGFRYYDEAISKEQEKELLNFIGTLNFQPYMMRGQASRRGIVRFGHDYGPIGGSHHVVQPMPPELTKLRAIAAEKIGESPEDFVASVVTCYPPGATIGWHSDMTQFGPLVFGVSLASSCTFRFRPKKDRSKNFKITLEPRSLYVMEGEIRSDWEHSIPPVKTLRYSITFRTLLDHPE